MFKTLRHSLAAAGSKRFFFFYRIGHKQAGIFLSAVCRIVNIGVHHSSQSVRKKGGPGHQGRVAPFVVRLTMLFVSKQLGGTRASNVDANKRPQPPRQQTHLLLKAVKEKRIGEGRDGMVWEGRWWLVTADVVLGDVLVDPRMQQQKDVPLAPMMHWFGQKEHVRILL